MRARASTCLCNPAALGLPSHTLATAMQANDAVRDLIADVAER